MTEETLADLIQRCEKAEASLNVLGTDRAADENYVAANRLYGKSEGVRLVLSYIRQAVRSEASA